jgi:hypothetical protein
LKEKARIKLMTKQKNALEVAAMETKGRALAIEVKQPHPVVDPIPSAKMIPLPLRYSLQHLSLLAISISDIFFCL